MNSFKVKVSWKTGSIVVYDFTTIYYRDNFLKFNEKQIKSYEII